MRQQHKQLYFWKLTIFAALSFGAYRAAHGQNQVESMQNTIHKAGQLIVVTTEKWQESSAILHYFQRDEEKTSGGWSLRNTTPAVIGRSGFGVGPETFGLNGPSKQEGDGRAPAGIFSLPFAFGLAGVSLKNKIRFPFRIMTAEDRCIDDSTSAYYNSIVDSAERTPKDWKSAEKMIHPDGLYDLGIFINYNQPTPSPKRGSCIFLHVWRAPNSPTDGCTAIAKEALYDLILWLQPERHPLLVQAPQEDYERLASTYLLPPLPTPEKSS